MKAFFFNLFTAFILGNVSAQNVFVTEYFSHADVKVYISKTPEDADLLVYKADKLVPVSENNGVWYFTENKNEAGRKIYFVNYTNRADLIIYFVDKKSLAGWKSDWKKYLMF
jgi:hypothetical protein